MTDSSSLQKQQLRRDLILRRSSISAEIRNQADAIIFDRLKDLVRRRAFQQIFAYFATQFEPEVMKYLTSTSGLPPVYAPVIGSNYSMEFHQVIPGQELHQNRFGIHEPAKSNPSGICSARTLMIIPCIAVSRLGDRLGYGGGYYDRYLASHSEAFKIGNVHHEFVRDLPHESHDVKLDGYCTEKELVIISPTAG